MSQVALAKDQEEDTSAKDRVEYALRSVCHELSVRPSSDIGGISTRTLPANWCILAVGGSREYQMSQKPDARKGLPELRWGVEYSRGISLFRMVSSVLRNKRGTDRGGIRRREALFSILAGRARERIMHGPSL